MTTNGKEQNISELTQWDRVVMLAFPIGAEEAQRRSDGIYESIGRMTGTETVECSVAPLIDANNNVHEMSPEEWAGTLARKAAAGYGISYAGEAPAPFDRK